MGGLALEALDGRKQAALFGTLAAEGGKALANSVGGIAEFPAEETPAKAEGIVGGKGLGVCAIFPDICAPALLDESAELGVGLADEGEVGGGEDSEVFPESEGQRKHDGVGVGSECGGLVEFDEDLTGMPQIFVEIKVFAVCEGGYGGHGGRGRSSGW